MIAYLYLKKDNAIIGIIHKVTHISDVGVVGESGSLIGIDLNLVGVICLDTDVDLTKSINGKEVNLENYDILPLNDLVDVKRRFEILGRLMTLDGIVSRETEQVYIDTNTTPSYAAMADAITEKTTLRLELQTVV